MRVVAALRSLLPAMKCKTDSCSRPRREAPPALDRTLAAEVACLANRHRCSEAASRRFRSRAGLVFGGALLLFVLIALCSAGRAQTPDWAGNFAVPGDGIAGRVEVVYDAGAVVYVGGTFTQAGSVAANNLAFWDKTTRTWSALGAGTNDTVSALAMIGSELYVAGWFGEAGGVTVNRIAKWDGANWSSLGGANSVVFALAVDGGELYAAGTFTTIGGVSAHVAKWNGSAWTAIGAATFISGRINVLAIGNGRVYAGGSFSMAGGIARLAQWDGLAWTAVGSRLDSTVTALRVHRGVLYVGGNFTNVATGIAQWDGSAWSTLGGSLDGPVMGLAASDDALYAVGDFTVAGGVPANRIARWDGSAWSALGSGVNAPALAVAVNATDVYVGGVFSQAGGSPSAGIARFSDVVAPRVARVSSTTANGTYRAGSSVALAVTFDETVVVTGTPTLALNSGGTAVYASGSGTNTLTFAYLVGAGDSALDLDYNSTGALALAGATVRDYAGNSADCALPSPGSANSLGGTAALAIDGVAPAVVSVTRLNPATQHAAGNVFVFRVAYSEPVSGVAAACFAVTGVNGGSVTGNVTGVTDAGDAKTYDVTVAIASGSGEFRLDVIR